jgi:hypothetical protein
MFCTGCARWLEGHGVGVRAIEIGSSAGNVLLRDLTPEERYAAFHAVDRLGRRRSGGAALPLVLRAVPGAVWLGALAGAFPRSAEIGYRLVARRRSLLSRLLARRVGSVRRASRARAG